MYKINKMKKLYVAILLLVIVLTGSFSLFFPSRNINISGIVIDKTILPWKINALGLFPTHDIFQETYIFIKNSNGHIEDIYVSNDDFIKINLGIIVT